MFNVGDMIYYLIGGIPHSARILVRRIVEGSDFDKVSAIYPMHVYKAGISYGTCHGVFDHEDVCNSREGLVELLMGKLVVAEETPTFYGHYIEKGE